MIQESKACTGCGENKSLDEFYWTTRRNGDKARHSKCQECRREQFSTWAKSDRGKQVKRAGILRREYRLTDEEYEALHAEQDGCCAICREPETKLHHTGSLCRLVVDHDHETGDVRGLLCSACNVGLGSFKDSPNRLNGAIAYLKGQATKTEAAEAKVADKPDAPFHPGAQNIRRDCVCVGGPLATCVLPDDCACGQHHKTTIADKARTGAFHMDTCRDKHCCIWPQCRCEGGLA